MQPPPLIRRLHRYLGIALCLLFAMWFASGVVLMYVDYPALEEDQRLRGLPGLIPEKGLKSPTELVAAVRPDSAMPRKLRLNSAPGVPAYHLLADTYWETFNARTGKPIKITPAMARAAADRHIPNGRPEAVEHLHLDQWTVSSRYDPHRPLLRLRMSDPADSLVYVSSRTGEVVLDTPWTERAWNRVGSVLHWIYPWQLRQYPEIWRHTVIGIAGAGTLLVMTGIFLGFRRLRPLGDHLRPISPYRGWHRWHHLLGIASAFFLLSFIVSGLFSLNPGQILASSGPAPEQHARWQGGPLIPDEAAHPGTIVSADTSIRELAWHRRAGEPLLLVRTTEHTFVHHAIQGKRAPFAEPELVARAERLLPGATIAAVDRLTAYDRYYYSRDGSEPLPVLRLRFDDAAATAVYIDPATGRLTDWIERGDRIHRWLYNGLHSLDFRFLVKHRPLWDAVLIGLCGTGFAFSVTGIVLGWRRLRHDQP